MRCKACSFGLAVTISTKYNNVRLFIIFVPKGSPELSIYCSKFSYIIPIVFQKFILSMKSSENFDANEFLGPTL